MKKPIVYEVSFARTGETQNREAHQSPERVSNEKIEIPKTTSADLAKQHRYRAHREPRPRRDRLPKWDRPRRNARPRQNHPRNRDIPSERRPTPKGSRRRGTPHNLEGKEPQKGGRPSVDVQYAVESDATIGFRITGRDPRATL